MSATVKRVSLAQQIAQLDKPAPDYDPEDEAVVGIDASKDISDLAAREHYVDVGPSSLRKLRDNVTDPKYEGVRISRKDLLEHSEERHGNLSDDVPEDEDENDSAIQHPDESGIQQDTNLSEGQSDDEDSSEESAPHVEGSVPTKDNVSVQVEDGLSSTLKRARDEERKKGKAVSRQLAIYDNLLDARIRFSKCSTSTNRLPESSEIPSYLKDHDSKALAETVLGEIISLYDDLSSLQENLVEHSGVWDIPPKKRRRREAPASSSLERDWEQEIEDCTKHLSELEASLHPHIVSTLQKWSNKVLAIAPSALLPSNRTKFSKSRDQVLSAVQLIDETLLDWDRLLARTRVWRGKGNRLGVENLSSNPEKNEQPAGNAGESGVVDVFDDTDFYQQLLRDVIDAKSGANGIIDGATEDWKAAQKLRKSRKAVDTRASKGRKLRYEVHEKIQNFMAPITAPSGASIAWHESQIDELFASVLGRGFENARSATVAASNVGVDAMGEFDNETSRRMEVDAEQALKTGFRVFG